MCQNVVMTAAVGLRERKKARTREALQEAAMDLFTRQGFDGTTVEEIADACEVSPRTFFRYFPTKEDVLFADTEARRERLLAVLADQPAGDPPFVVLHAAMRALGARLPPRPRRARRPLEDRRRRRRSCRPTRPSTSTAGRPRSSTRSSGAPSPRTSRSTGRSCSSLTAVATAALRVSLDVWVADAAAPTSTSCSTAAFGRLAAGFDHAAS